MENFSGEKMNKHPFVHKLYMALAYANVAKYIYKICVKEIRHAFIQKNVLSMDGKQCDEIGYDNCCIIGRSFIETVKENSSL